MVVIRRTPPPDEQGFDELLAMHSKNRLDTLSMVMFFMFDGDYLGDMRRIGNVLSAGIRPTDGIGRSRANEFVLMISEWRDSQLPASLFQRFCQSLDTIPYAIGITVSYAIYPFDGVTVNKLRHVAQTLGIIGRCHRTAKGH